MLLRVSQIWLTIFATYVDSVRLNRLAMYNCRSSREKLERSEEKKSSELKYLRRCGIAIEIDFQERDKQPCLVNLAADPMLSGTLLYLLPPGLVRIGRNAPKDKLEASPKEDIMLDIILDGPLVRELHWLVTDCVCLFFWRSGKVEKRKREKERMDRCGKRDILLSMLRVFFSVKYILLWTCSLLAASKVPRNFREIYKTF